MKILSKTLAAFTLLVCICFINVNSASAKVCFASDPGCSGGADFGNYVDPGSDGTLCIQEGYTAKDVCLADVTKYIVSYCPYNPKYVMCCGREYAYDACVYPLKNDGKCGNRYKCVCDSTKFKYKQQSAVICKDVVNNIQYNNSLASGASCVYSGFEAGKTTVNSQFTECLCDRGLYPKTESECTLMGSTASGNVCADSNGNKFYSTCLCGDAYKVISSDCKYGTYIDEKLCQQGDVYKAKRCCTCNDNTYPYYEQVDEATVETYASCEKEQGCTRGNRYRATSCKQGYKIDSGKCVPKECDELLPEYIALNKITSYELFVPGKSPTKTNVIVAGDVTGYGLARPEYFLNKKVISGAVYAQTIKGSDSLTSLIKLKCTKTPTLDMGQSYSMTSGSFDFTSLFLKMSYFSDYQSKGKFTCTNCSLYVSGSFNIQYGSAEFKYDSSLPNANNLYIDVVGLSISRAFHSTGYDIKVGSLGLNVDNKSKSVVMFEGISNSRRMTLEADRFGVIGVAAIKYANARPKQTCIGASCSYGDTSSGVYFNGDRYNTSSSISLYSVDYYIYDATNARSNTLHMTTSTMLGTPGDQSSNIRFFKNNYHWVGFAQLFGDCSDSGVGDYPYITSYGTFSSLRLGCHYYYSSVRCGEGNRKPDDIRCKIDGSESRTHLSGDRTTGDCRWMDKGNDCPSPYFKFDGQRGF